MKRKELFEKNLELSFEFSRYLTEHPEVAETIPRGAIVVILPEDDQKLANENLRIAKQKREKGQPLVIVKVQKLAPERKSRLIKPRIKIVTAP